jgi:anti-sigma-K factor RskA
VDLSCIISSGDLELYVLGMLPEEEAFKIAQLATLFPEVQEEVNRISESLESLENTTTAAPSPSVKDALMSKLTTLKAEEQRRGSNSTVEEPKETGKSFTPVVSLHKPRQNQLWLAASFIGFILSLGAVFYLISQNKKNKTELASVQQEATKLRNDLNSQQQKILAYSETMQMLHDDNYMKINLTNVPGKPQAIAQVFWNTKTKEVYIADVSLPQTPSDKQYQLWAIVDGKPVDAGMLSDAKNLAQKIKVFEKADAFAITLENKGGSPTPTMDQMYVMSKV